MKYILDASVAMKTVSLISPVPAVRAVTGTKGGLSEGVVTVRGDQIEPQPRDAPVRPAGELLRGAKIIDFRRDDDQQTYVLKYDLRGRTHSVKYTIDTLSGRITSTGHRVAVGF